MTPEIAKCLVNAALRARPASYFPPLRHAMISFAAVGLMQVRMKPSYKDLDAEPHNMSQFGAQIPVIGSRSARFWAFLGPGYLVATGYMDPGNWATAVAAGSRFGTQLLYVAVASSLMAILFQSLAARLALTTGQDLASLCRLQYRQPIPFLLWAVAQTAVVATDMAEVIGTAIGLELLFGLPLWIGVLLTALDAVVVMGLERFGIRKLEAFIFGMVFLITGAFAAQLVIAKPSAAAILAGLKPSAQLIANPEMLYLAVGVVGATIMPHNLYLHSGLMQSRHVENGRAARREAISFALVDSALALTAALVVNASILILAASIFHRAGHTDVAELGQAYHLIEPLLGSALAAKLFALALIACGLNSTVAATLSGQIVTSGFLNIKMSATVLRTVTRMLAIAPAVAVTLALGESATAHLLVLSQVVLSIALPFAMLPLIQFSSMRKIMGDFRAPIWTLFLAMACAALILALNAKLLIDAIS